MKWLMSAASHGFHRLGLGGSVALGSMGLVAGMARSARRRQGDEIMGAVASLRGWLVASAGPTSLGAEDVWRQSAFTAL